MNRYDRRAALGLSAVMLVIAGMLVGVRPAAAQRPDTTTVQVEATQEAWQDTGIELADGDVATLVASGSAGWEPGIAQGPAGGGASNCTLAVPNAAVGAVLARAGSGAPVAIGVAGRVSGPGRISVLYNDCPGQYFDNSGRFEVRMTVTLAAPATPQPTAQPTAQPVTAAEPVAPAAERPVAADGGKPVLPILAVVIVLVGAGVYLGRRVLPKGPAPRFSESARLESSAWLAPVRLALLQRRWIRRALTIGGPDADIDFGVQGKWARLLPQKDGTVRLEVTGDGGRVMVDGMPLVLGKRLHDGSRVFMGTREFIFRIEAGGEATTAINRGRHTDLSRPDPRAAPAERPGAGRNVA